ncbi:ComEC/Rec2 family competence protein [Sulfurovum sp. XGS-02]|uniref:ComEC/Rec2 family competence protein n=1 Tax=Sulfurovum sp. XGS-02 TaxID=2925411 RepID=UPI00204A60B6|nr:ComEC/Rec2 family competence protein [Sulfurovum sp. XGS-02]UPT77304.1 ComEC/Rec2 family competence protein [Sulfurovum sp. XGS-02]
MQLEKPKLFPEKRTFIWAALFFLCVIVIRLFFEYHSYQDFISKPFYYTHANVLNVYQKSKGDQHYQVLKLRSEEGLTFYITNYTQEKFDHKRLRLQLFPNERISFSDYLGTFYVNSRIKARELLPSSFKEILLEKVASQHENTSLGSFYNAIFFATFLEKALREKISMLGVSHLVALSGFHLGILWGLVYGLLLLLYRPLQQHFFPYRHALTDVGAVAMILLGVYLWFVDFPPSLLRSYAMVLVGWMVLLLGMELLSFTFLTTIILLLVALFPSLLVSLSFGLSVAGVFYIFLLLQHSKGLHAWVITLLLIPLGIFILMLPIVHTVFPVTSGYQFLSPLLSLLFVPFYPFVMLLHLLGYGSLFDTVLLALFTLPNISTESLFPLWATVGYIGISIGAIWSKKLFWSVWGGASSYMLYLFIFVQ